jgi:hypothetical protein
MLFYPDLPRPINKITDICNRLKISISNNPLSHFDLAIHWNYNTYCKLPDAVKKLHEKKPFINGDLFDVSKSYVDSVFKEVFTYSTLLKEDHGLKYGVCIKKSELQASHDALIVKIPFLREQGFVYQKFLDSRFCYSHCMDLRVPIFKQTIPVVFGKIKAAGSPIKSVVGVSTHEPLEVFSQDEIDKILLFSQYMGMDFGELDIIRNNSDHEIYIIDVNNMAGNQLFRHFSSDFANRLLQLYADQFKLNFLP